MRRSRPVQINDDDDDDAPPVSSQVQSQDATTEYVDFLISTASAQTKVSVICAAMAPCMRLYAFLGSTLKHAQPATPLAEPNAYEEWIETYATKDFEGLAETLEVSPALPSAHAYSTVPTLHCKPEHI